MNDFLLSWAHEAPPEELLERAAIAICHRHSGIGADGWIVLTPTSLSEPAAMRVFNSDGSAAEISGNGTRCAAAWLAEAGLAATEIAIRTGAGVKRLRLVSRREMRFVFEMNMGAPAPRHLQFPLALAGGSRECTILDVGNPQCVFFVEDFDFDWQTLGAEVERHPQFPNRTNVSFVQVLDRHTIDVRFFERGAGFTMSSGTGSTGAFCAALTRGLVDSPVTVRTLAGPLSFRSDQDTGEVSMQGPAEIVGGGEFYFPT
ncbi:MAG: diaminopimelate epimerase [Bryobacteraceae bacterium]